MVGGTARRSGCIFVIDAAFRVAAVACAILLLPPEKGAALALLWAVDETN